MDNFVCAKNVLWNESNGFYFLAMIGEFESLTIKNIRDTIVPLRRPFVKHEIGWLCKCVT